MEALGTSKPAVCGEPVVCTPNSRCFRHFGSVVSVTSANPALNSLVVAVRVVFVVFVISVVIAKSHRRANNRFGIPQV